MNILHINFEFPPVIGGGAAEAFLLYREIAKKHSVTVLTASAKNSPTEETMEGIRVIRCPVAKEWDKPGYSSTLSLITFLPSLLNTFNNKKAEFKNINLINAWFAIPTGVGSGYIAKSLNIPSVLTLCGGDIYDPIKKMAPNRNWITRQFVRYALNSNDILTAISTDLAEKANIYMPSPKPIKVIPMGVDPKQYSPSIFRDAPEPFQLVTACRLVERKGVAFVIQALSKIKDQNFQFHIIGEGPEKENLHKLSENLGLKNQIIFEGYVNEDRKEELYQLADAFILTSFHEGQCQAILEGALHGLPIITSNVGGQTDMIKDGKTGLLVTPGNVNEIATSIQSIISSTSLRRLLRNNILEVVKKYFIHHTATNYIDLFDSVIQSKGTELKCLKSA